LKTIQNSAKYKSIELFLLFFLLPVLLASPIYKYIKFSIVGIAVIYVAYFLIKAKQWKSPKVDALIKTQFWKRITVFSSAILILGIVILQIYDPSQLFKVPQHKPLLWVTILFVYSFFSVLPQELIYRKFFYMRYESLFQNKKLFFCINVLCFSLCHLFLKNIWVILITLLGGILFTYTYQKTKSVTLVAIEHSIYGNLVFTVGLGTMLAFPG